jgi:sugar-specific transcriptional regulator TrmB
MVLQKLLDVGLNEREAKVYLALLELGEANIAKISQKARIKRSTVYDMLELLKEKGLISQSTLKKRPIYFAENPQKIIEDLETKKKGIEEVMPELVAVMNVLDKKPKMRYFEGTVAVKEIFEDTLQYFDSEILTWFPYPYLNLGEDYFWKYYNVQRVKRKIWMRVIMPDREENQKISQKMKAYIVSTKFVSAENFSNFDIEIKIYDKIKIGIISHKENLGIMIESKKIFDGFKGIFEEMWANAKN